APYWKRRLGREDLVARQCSARGGTLHCEVRDGRVLLTGGVRRYLDGTVHLPDDVVL
ncbi:MAG: isomerase, partial [Acidimicrobiaceae bacterium]|nr:isomerase [Acidimicrobiaceae bacterium]